ncbi:MAG: hypothetical protein ACTSR8_00370 [Promethearchaeota archaeon]
MNSLLFSGYITTIVIVIAVLLIIVISWSAYIPRRMLFLLNLSFSALISALIIILIAELLAPFSSDFYLSPTLYTLYFGLLGFFYIAIFLLVIEIFYNNLSILYRLAWMFLLIIIVLLFISEILLLNLTNSNYPWINYLLFEFVLIVCIIAYSFLVKAGFSYATSDRFEAKHRFGFILISIFSIIIIIEHALLVFEILIVDFSIATDVYIMLIWLWWVSWSALTFLLMMRGAIKTIF